MRTFLGGVYKLILVTNVYTIYRGRCAVHIYAVKCTRWKVFESIFDQQLRRMASFNEVHQLYDVNAHETLNPTHINMVYIMGDKYVINAFECIPFC